MKKTVEPKKKCGGKTILLLRSLWKDSSQKTEEKRTELFNESAKSCGLVSRKQIKLEKELSDSIEIEKNKLETYHRWFNNYIAYNLNKLATTSKELAEEEIEGIKSGDDWIYVFDVLKKYGVKI